MKAEGERRSANEDLSKRTREFALRIIRLYTSLPKSTEAQVLGKQILRSGTSIGAQNSEAKRAKSNKDFINKIEGALQELEETAYWLDLLTASRIGEAKRLQDLRKEAEELIAIFVSIVKKVKSRP